jgi:methyl-accepting chemotaxis protein
MRLSLRAKFFAPIFILVVVGMAALVLVNDRAVKSAFTKVEGQTMALLGQSLAKDVAGSVADNLKLLSSFAKAPALARAAQGQGGEAASELMASLVKGMTGVDYANVFDASGLCLASTNPAAVGKVNVADRDYYAAVMKADKTDVVSKALVSRTTGKAAVVLAQPIRDAAGKLVGLVNAGMDLESLTADLTSLKVGTTGYAFILDAQGMVLAHPDKSQLMKDDLGRSEAGRRVLGVAGGAVLDYEDASGRHLVAVTRDARTGWFVAVEAPMAEFGAYADAATRQNAIIALIVTVAILAAILVLLRVAVLGKLRQCVDFAAAVAKGDLDRRIAITSGDELQTLGEALAAMGESIKANLAEAQAKSREAEVQAVQVAKALEDVKAAQAKAEAAKTQGLLMAADRLQGVMEALDEVAAELSREITTVAASVEEQERRTSETATAMEEMNATVLEVAKNAAEASTKADAARAQAVDGRAVVERSITAIGRVDAASRQVKAGMDELGAKAQAIGAIMNVISDIADQTNLLALNAAIEAARAGDAGRGFAVVADEVRKLAEKTMTATKEVGASIGAIQAGARDSMAKVDESTAAVAHATELAGESEAALARIVALVDETSSQVQGIATAAEEQSATSEEISRAEEEVSRLSSEIAQGMRESAGVVTSVSRQVEALEQLVDTFRKNCIGDDC